MKLIKLTTLGLLGLSIAMTSPAFAQEVGTAERGTEERGDAGRGTADAQREDSERGNAGRDEDGERPSRRPSRAAADPMRVGTPNTTAGGQISDEELELTCGDGGWLETWLEDANGNPIADSYEYYCLD